METRISDGHRQLLSQPTHFRLRIFSFAALLIISSYLSAAPILDTVVADGKEWAQVDLFTNLSANDFLEVCPNLVCNDEELNGWDMNGWRWATVEEVGALFSALSPHPGGIFFYLELRASWDLNIFNAGFRATQSRSGTLELRGITADRGEVGHYVGHWKRDPGFAGNDWANTVEEFPDFFTNLEYGGWFYKVTEDAVEARQVPLPIIAVALYFIFTVWAVSKKSSTR